VGGGSLAGETPNRPERDLGSRSADVKKSIAIAKWILGAAGTGGLAEPEVRRILAAPASLANWLCLILMLLVALQVGSWVYCASDHLNKMSRWASPSNYQPPPELIRIVAFAALFIAMFYAARNPLAFGAFYVVYAVLNLLTMRHLREETAQVIGSTRLRFALQPEDDLVKIRRIAVDVLESYFQKLLSPGRAWATLLAGACGLAVAIDGRTTNSPIAQIIAYLIFIASVGVPELVLSWIWRSTLDRQLRRCEAAMP